MLPVLRKRRRRACTDEASRNGAKAERQNDRTTESDDDMLRQ
jgi:hypothetical protein